jgi:hypothetical protein
MEFFLTAELRASSFDGMKTLQSSELMVNEKKVLLQNQGDIFPNKPLPFDGFCIDLP